MAGLHGTWQGWCSAQFSAVVGGVPPNMGAIQASPSGPALIHGFVVDALFLNNGSPMVVALAGSPPLDLVFTVSFTDDVGNLIDVLSTDAEVETYGPGGVGDTGLGVFWNFGGLFSGDNLTLGKQYTITWT